MDTQRAHIISGRWALGLGRKGVSAVATAFLLGLAAIVMIQPQRAAADDEASDPPGRVARVSYLKGAVSLQPAGTDDWVNAGINRPLTTGDELWVDRDSRAELQVGSAVIHLDEGTGFSFLDLDDRAMQMRVTEGAVNVRIRSLAENETVEIDTPNVAVSLSRPGEYRVDVASSGDQTAVTVRDGSSEVSGDGEVFTLRRGERGTYTGIERLAESREPAGARDEFDAWANERDLRAERSASTQYVDPEVIGYEDLDDYGSWASVPDYGYVWYPRTVVVGWSPYRYGHWVWIAPWGWTWIDDAPWGFAPFHYGRWAYVNTRWCWVPGPARVRPVYAPALVGWVNPHRGHGRVGWFPLGPRDVYVPGHHVSEHYVRTINTTGSRFIDGARVTHIYRTPRGDYRDQWGNRRTPNAITTVSQQTFVNAQPVSRHLVRGNESELARAPVTSAVPNIAPGRSSVIGAGNAVNVRRPVPSQIEREVVVRRAPPAAPPTFALQQRAIEANGGRVPPRADFMRSRETGEHNEAVRVRSAIPGGIVRPTSPAAAPAMRVPPAQSNPAPGAAPEISRPAAPPQPSVPPTTERMREPTWTAPPDRTYRPEPQHRQFQEPSHPRENTPWRTERVAPAAPAPAPVMRQPEIHQQPTPVRPPERVYESRPAFQPHAVAPPPRPVEAPRPVERMAPPNHAPPPSVAPARAPHGPAGHEANQRDR